MKVTIDCGLSREERARLKTIAEGALGRAVEEVSETVEVVFYLKSVPAVMLPRCDGCRWWKWHGAGVAALVAPLHEIAAKVGVYVQPLGDCTLFECHSSEQVNEGSKLIVTRTRSGEATIVTTADFGCVQFEARS